MTVNGFGLNGTDVSVLVDGVPCQVEQAVNHKITCVTGVKDSASAEGFQPGNFGLNLIKKADATSYEHLNSDDTYVTTEEKIVSAFEVWKTNTNPDTYMQRVSGWFTAPATAQYRFFISCAKNCKFSISTSAFSEPTAEVPELTEVASRTSTSSWRNYWNLDGSEVSDWIDLEEGQSYYIKGD